MLSIKLFFGDSKNREYGERDFLSLETINHQQKFRECIISGGLVYTNSIRRILKKVDTLLAVNGVLIISERTISQHGYGVLSKSQLMYEVSMSLNGRYKLLQQDLVDNITKLSYKKIQEGPLNNNAPLSWSFGIITNGKNKEGIDRLINSIKIQDIDNYEIVICGPKLYDQDESNLRYISDVDEGDIRAPISKKKNRLVQSFRYINVILLHDRFELPPDWYKNVLKFHEPFEVLCLPNLNRKTQGRMNDWMYFKGLPNNRWSIARIATTYKNDRWNYLPGGIIIAKKFILERVALNENLFWGELEDVDWTLRLKLEGYDIWTDTNNFVLTESKRIKPLSRIHKIRFIGPLILYIKLLSSCIVRVFRNKLIVSRG